MEAAGIEPDEGEPNPRKTTVLHPEPLSPACPPGESDEENINENNLLMVEAAGIEPAPVRRFFPV